MPRFRIRTLVIAVAVAAIALCFIMIYGQAVIASYESEKPFISTPFGIGCDLTFSPIAVLSAFSLWLEQRRNPERREWGIGRWSWAFSGVLVFIRSVVCLLWWTLGKPSFIRNPTWHSLLRMPHNIIWHAWSSAFVGSNGWECVIAALITASWAKRMDDPILDAREWTGRVFAGTLVLAATAKLVMAALGW